MFTPSKVTVLNVNKTWGTIQLKIVRSDGVTEIISIDLPNDLPNKEHKIIAVYRKHLDRNQLLGYAVGNHTDITAYFENEKGYGLEMNVVIAKKIPIGYAKKKHELQTQKERLEHDLTTLNKQIDSKDI